MAYGYFTAACWRFEMATNFTQKHRQVFAVYVAVRMIPQMFAAVVLVLGQCVDKLIR